MKKQKTNTAAACLGGGGGGGGEDFLIEILVRLPVVSLLRFKSVCKSWYDLIQTSFFIHLHTTTASNSSSSSKFGSFIVHAFQDPAVEILMLSSESGSESGGIEGTWHKFTGGGGDWHWDNNITDCGCWYWVSDDDDDDDDDDAKEDKKKKKKSDDDDDDEVVLKLDSLGVPPSSKKLSNTEVIVGSCNGLICLYDSDIIVVSLWNPATRQFRILPNPITIEEGGIGKFFYDFVAFGFDVKTKDYKVLMITCFDPTSGGDGVVAALVEEEEGPKCICQVQVYSLSTDSWRLLEEGINSLPLPIANHYGLYMNGSCFFVGTKITTSELLPSNNSLMFSFDFTKETFTTMQFPDHDYRYRLILSYLGKKLALYTTKKSSSGLVEPGPRGDDQSLPTSTISYEDYDIWVWNEHGGASSSSSSSSVNKESWTKLHSFRIRGGGATEWSQWTTFPRGISNNGEFALIETTCNNGLKCKIQLFNLVTKEAKKDFIICDEVGRTEVYQQSLVSIIGGNDASTTSHRR